MRQIEPLLAGYSRTAGTAADRDEKNDDETYPIPDFGQHPVPSIKPVGDRSAAARAPPHE
jgi:hypothetical protein